MKRLAIILLLFSFITVSAQDKDSITIRKIYDEVLLNGKGYEWLRELTTNIGPRISGSANADKAVQWAKEKMIEAGADTVYLQPVLVPHWERGENESAVIIENTGNKTNIPLLALGGSIATPKEGIRAKIIEVHDFDELEKLGKEKIAGNIVFYNHPFDETFVNTFAAYSEAGKYRWNGPSRASKLGAIATICRSMTSAQDDFPHTGAMRYADTIPKIPCGAISTNAADLLARVIRSGGQPELLLKIHSAMKDSVNSFNVIGEIRGSKFPDEIIVAGGHLDSWDNCSGAHDDGAGIVHTIEVLRVFKSLGIKPQRTIRIVAFMNEENGLCGGREYAAVYNKKQKHIAAIESDEGGFVPIGFGGDMTDDKRKKLKEFSPYLLPYGLYDLGSDGGGADISPLEGIPQIGLEVSNQRYFDYHHAASDTFDKVNRRELHLGTAAISALVYLISEKGF